MRSFAKLLEKILFALQALSAHGKRPKKARKISFIIEGELTMAFQLQDTQKVTITAVGVNAVGNVVPTIFGPVIWTASDPELLDVVSIGAFQAQVVTKGPLGTCRVTGQAWSDAAKTIQIFGVLDVEVITSPATGLRLDVGTPEIR
jgi:hypothetical protein